MCRLKSTRRAVAVTTSVIMMTTCMAVLPHQALLYRGVLIGARMRAEMIVVQDENKQ
jgi:hypothetical protein